MKKSMEHWWNRGDKWKRKCSEKTLSKCHFIHPKSLEDWNWLWAPSIREQFTVRMQERGEFSTSCWIKKKSEPFHLFFFFCLPIPWKFETWQLHCACDVYLVFMATSAPKNFFLAELLREIGSRGDQKHVLRPLANAARSSYRSPFTALPELTVRNGVSTH